MDEGEYLEFEGPNSGLLLFLDPTDQPAREVWNQCGGIGCHQMMANTSEIRPIHVPDAVYDHFVKDLSSWCCDGITSKTAAIIEENVPGFTVDHDMMDESQEAWIFGFYDGRPCVLAFENSD